MESNTIIRVLLLLTLCTSNLQARKVSNFDTFLKDNDESFGEYDDEDERKTYKTWMKKLDESENIVEGMLDGLEEMRPLEDFNGVEEQKHDIPKEVAVQSKERAYCELINTPYKIPFKSADEYLLTSWIRKDTCGGYCHPKKRCVTTKTKTLQVIVEKAKCSDPTATSSHTVTFESALECGYQCKIKETDCSRRQRFDNESCECRCPLHFEYAKILCLPKKQWSQSECDCVCSSTAKDCSLGKQWNSNTCGCEKINVIPTCDSGRSLNQTSCVCN